MSYGTESWGLDVWGADPTFRMDSAVAATTHSVYITFSRPPRAVSPLSQGDALRNSTWSINGYDFSDPKVIVAVTMVGNRRAEITVSTPFKSSNYKYKINATTLMSSSGVYVSPPYELTFRGLLAADPTTERQRAFDVNVLGEALQVTSGGSYARVHGLDLLRKMILRRISTMPGSFFHLSPDEFGLGLRSKEFVKVSALPNIKKRIEDEVNKELGITGTVASLEASDGIISVKLKVTTEFGPMEVSVLAR